MTNIANAVNAYAAFAKLPSAEGMEARDTPTPVPGSDFASVLKDAAKMSLNAVKQGEQMSAAGIAGKADIREVVAAVNNAEMTLETVVTVRDKVINAYNEILRMPI
ncbi:Flagellar hook-basal body complex protein fliE [Magnetospirillum gryphiswaldense MSR-1 v2]|uniref:Flagellar hook-basal body complex protein FliE n=1 Tax=Magnetospirillum gryphiswaldense (strain DSM 6361 / JCM 21280 / NBRC 15271 / MSR-1) TaxID=431944 RepID=V6F475_MAGGM|nr:flagellar hook-basal body complex protein FliE [Magnetospirillum gryphiswaldense]CDL00197.1 Flagellar hook-basal body complex protein fliE [Magnetospirillum gryphiswaldense MSR-1 v2]